jgi:hypothetical protein
MNTPNEKIKTLITKLSPVKKKIGEKFLVGTKESLVIKLFRKAFVTMVLNKIKTIDKNYFDGKNYEIVKTKIKSDYDNVDKDIMRTLVRLEVEKSKKEYGIKKGLILTLSCFECFMEKIINAYSPLFNFLSYECDLAHFVLLKNNIKNKALKFMLNPINDKIIKGIEGAKKDTYAHLLLDFCQSLVTHSKDIELALKNDIVQKGGIIWITLTTRLGRGYKGYNTEKELAKLIDRVGGGKYKLVREYKYRTGAPMYSVILRRIK